MRLILLVGLSLLASALFAQKDYRAGWVRTFEGDTLKGLVQYKVSNKITTDCKFKDTEQAAVKKFSATQISGFGYLNDKVFLSKDTIGDATNNEVFMEEIVHGGVSLFRYGKVFYLEKDKMYKLEEEVSQTTDQNVQYEQKKNKYSGVINYLFSDCNDAGFSKEILQADLKETDLARLTTKYNKCVGSPSVEYKKNQKSSVIEYVAMTGVALNDFAFTFSSQSYVTTKNASGTSITPLVGVGIQVSSPRVLENVAFTAEIQFSSLALNETRTRDLITSTVTESYQLDYFRTIIPIGMKVNLSSAAFSPYLRGGMSLSFYSNGKFSGEQTKKFPTSPDTYNSGQASLEGFKMIQFFIAAGVECNVGKKLKGFAELRGEALGGNANIFIRSEEGDAIIEGKSIKSKTLSLLVGIKF